MEFWFFKVERAKNEATRADRRIKIGRRQILAHCDPTRADVVILAEQLQAAPAQREVLDDAVHLLRLLRAACVRIYVRRSCMHATWHSLKFQIQISNSNVVHADARSKACISNRNLNLRAMHAYKYLCMQKQ